MSSILGFKATTKVNLDDIPIKLSKDKVVAFSAITTSGQKILQPMFEEWISVCPPELLNKINLKFN